MSYLLNSVAKQEKKKPGFPPSTLFCLTDNVKKRSKEES